MCKLISPLPHSRFHLLSKTDFFLAMILVINRAENFSREENNSFEASDYTSKHVIHTGRKPLSVFKNLPNQFSIFVNLTAWFLQITTFYCARGVYYVKIICQIHFFPSFFLHRSDLLFCSLLLVLAITVGYFGNHCLTNAPKTSDDAESQEATSLLLTATFVLGQASGSFLSFFVLKSIWCKFCCWWRPAEMILKKVLTVKKIYV